MPLLSPNYQELVRLILAKAITASAARQLMMQGYSARQIVRSVHVPLTRTRKRGGFFVARVCPM